MDARRDDWWEAARRRAEWWYRPLVEPLGWLSYASLFVGAIWAPIALCLALGALATAFGLVIVVAGIPLVVFAFVFVDLLARLQRARARWIGEAIAPRALRPHRGVGVRAMRTVCADGARWRQVAFVCADVVVAPVLLVVAAVPLLVVAELVFGLDTVDYEPLPGGPLGVVLGLAVAGCVPRAAHAVARTKVAFDRWFLGPDRLAAMSARVRSLATQRQDVLDAVAIERRRIERNLHDGVQQQLVAVGIDLGMAVSHLDDDLDRARALLLQARARLQGSIGELRQLGRGLHPAILGDRGLDAALSAVVADSPIPISVHVDPTLDLPTDVAETAYFVANEGVANILKHAQARVASIHLVDLGGRVRLTVHDDGRGGADPSGGTGLAGLRARVVAMDGSFALTSPLGGPTTLVVEVPIRG